MHPRTRRLGALHPSTHSLPHSQALLLAVVLSTSIGGLLAAAVTKHLDSIAKIYCAALASAAIGLATAVLFPAAFALGLPFVVGTAAILCSAAVYVRDAPLLPSCPLRPST
jgi:hypothetical protein